MSEPSSSLFTRRSNAPVTVITQAAPPRSAELARRQRNYIISMSIRVACFLTMAFVHGWLRWACLAGAAFIPWIAVILANVSTKGPVPVSRHEDTDEVARPMLPAGEVIKGEWDHP